MNNVTCPRSLCHFKIRLNGFGASALILNTYTGGTSVSAPSLTPGKTYYWRVQASTSTGKSVYSGTWKCTYKANASLKLKLVSVIGTTVTVRATLINADSGAPIPGKSLTFYENTNDGAFASKGTVTTGSPTSATPGVATKSWKTVIGSHQPYTTFKGDTSYAAVSSDSAEVTYIKDP